jgi:membrane associated rhomboid family serine protease
MIVFPVMIQVVYILVAYPIGFVMGLLLDSTSHWTPIVGNALVIGALIVGVVSSFSICRAMWPRSASAGSGRLSAAHDGK